MYTLRKAGDSERPLYELTKWDPAYKHPIDVYVQWVVKRADGSRSVHSCNCPSRSNPCKHVPMTLELLEAAGNVDDQLAFFYWDDGVKEAGDI